MKSKNKNNLKKRILIFVFVFIIAFSLCVPCFAWTYPPWSAGNGDYIYGYIDNVSGFYCACVYSGDNGANWDCLVDFTIIDVYNTDPSLWTRVPIGAEVVEGGVTLNVLNSYLTTVKNNQSVFDTNEMIINLENIVYYYEQIYNKYGSTYTDFFTVTPQETYNVISERVTAWLNGTGTLQGVQILFETIPVVIIQNTLEPFIDYLHENNIELSEDLQDSLNNLVAEYNKGYNLGYDEGSAEWKAKYEKSYNTGYTDGATDSNYMENTLITIFSSPYYILNEIFNFEIFGVNLASIIMFIVTIIIVGFIIRVVN